MRFDEIMPYSVDFIVPGFERSYPKGIFNCLSFTRKPSQEWFHEFADLVCDTMGKKYLPLYRMGAGEYAVAVGFRPYLRMQGEPFIPYFARTGVVWARQITKRLLGMGFRDGGFDYPSSLYSASEMAAIRLMLASQLRQVAQEGILSMLFTYRKTQFAQQYFVPVTQWLKKNKIDLNATNYFPVYFVYALLNGPFRHRIYSKKRILVVTAFDDVRKTAIERSLVLEGVADVQFIAISRGHSMFDIINLNTVQLPVDIALVAAGPGSANIALQLKPLNTVTIDAGFCVDCLADPSLKWKRTFCLPDEERNGNYDPI